MKYLELVAQLECLEQQMKQIQSEGEALFDARIDSSKPGGSAARGNPAVQYRLRVKGQPAVYLKPDEINSARASVHRGRQLQKLEQQIHRVQMQIDRIVAQAAKLGLLLPEE